ncbi:MAG: HAD family hydrolase [Planctomycetota bacterium]|jgi:phosphoglycolate phosphatase
MKRQAVIFDLDGTLLDTLEDLADSGNHTLARYGLPTHPVDAYRYFIGDGVGMLIRRMLPEGRRNEDTIGKVTKTYREEYGRRWNVKTKPYDGIGELLDALKAAKIKTAVLSNKPHELTEKCVGELLSRWTFDAALGHRDGIARKPDPAGALWIARQWRLAPSEIVYVGDTATDMETAVAAGMYPCGVLWGFRPAQELLTGGAKVLIERPIELLDVLDGEG